MERSNRNSLHSDVCCLLRYGSSTLRFVVVKIIALSGILAWCATPVIFNGDNRPWRLRWNAAGRCHNILDVISDLFWREAPQKFFGNGNLSENEKEKKCKDAYSRYYSDLYINPCKLEFLILLNPSSVSPDADNITRCAFRNLCYEIYDQETMTQKRVTLQRSYTKFK